MTKLTSLIVALALALCAPLAQASLQTLLSFNAGGPKASVVFMSEVQPMSIALLGGIVLLSRRLIRRGEATRV
jgi:hypothetical protein